MERLLSGYGMRIVMKPDATDRQIEIAKKMYPNALVVRDSQNKLLSIKGFLNSVRAKLL